MVSMTFFTFSLMMPSHYEGSGVFPEILGKDRMMVEQRNFGIGQETTLGAGRPEKVGNGCPLLEMPRVPTL